MKAIGIRELKAQLSRYLREVAEGEVVFVTDRGRVVAELRAPGEPRVIEESATERRLRQLAAGMPLSIGGAPDKTRYPASPVRLARGAAKKLLDDERAEP